MARSAWKLRQDIYVVTKTETRIGIDLVKSYSKPKKYRLSVSATTGVPSVFNSGIVPDYDREITVYVGQFTGFDAPEGALLYVDVTPEIADDGYLVLSDGEPTIYPDYELVRKISTLRGKVSRYGIKKVSYGNP